MADESARAQIESLLAEYGLSGLASTVWRWWLDGRPIERIMVDLKSTAEYKTRFPAMDELAKKGRAISETEYIGYERQAVQLFRAAGLPAGFYDQPEDFARLIAGEVSIRELSERVSAAAEAAFASPPEVRAQLRRLYGVDEGAVTAWFLDETRAMSVLSQQFTAGKLAGAAARTGFGDLTRTEAERLAQLGVSEQQAQEGFSTLAESRELFGALPGFETEDVSRDVQLGAAFEGNASAQEQVRKRAERRKAVFAEGGGFASSQEGFAGLGTAR